MVLTLDAYPCCESTAFCHVKSSFPGCVPDASNFLGLQGFGEDVQRTFWALFVGRMMFLCGKQDTLPWPGWLEDARPDPTVLPGHPDHACWGGPLSTFCEIFTMLYGIGGAGRYSLPKVGSFRVHVQACSINALNVHLSHADQAEDQMHVMSHVVALFC